MTSQSLSSWLNMNIKSDDIDCGLAADFDGSLSGLGVELGSSTYNMSEALLALPVFKQENLESGLMGSHGYQGVHFGNFYPHHGHRMTTLSVPQPQPRLSQNELSGFHGNAQGTAQYACRSEGQASTAVSISQTRHSRPQSLDSEDACHSKEQHSPSSNDAQGFSVDVLRGALLTTTEVNRCRYVLHAATSPATKMNEETLTYLNQGQSYEIKLTKYGDSSEFANLKSIIRVVFHDRRLQYAELEQLQQWRMGRPGERLLDIDVPLSTGVFDVVLDSSKLNSISFKWDPNKECGVFVKVHCISTEFTPKKHGGEKGVPFRVQVETYGEDEDGYQLIHCASCQVKVFKPKGADRKQKTDRDKMEKRSGAEKEKYQPSYEVTVLSEIPLEQAQSYLDQLAQQELQQPDFKKLPENKKWSHTSSLPTTPEPSERPVRLGSFGLGESFSPNSSVESLNLKKKEEPAPEAKAPDETKPLSSSATAAEVQIWLQANRFPNYVKVFQNFSGSDLLRLTRDDLIQICGLVDGIRLNNALQSKAVRPKLTIYVSQCDEQNTKNAPRQNQQQQKPPQQQIKQNPKQQQQQNNPRLRISSSIEKEHNRPSGPQSYRDRGGESSCSSVDSLISHKISPTRTQGNNGSIQQASSSKRQYRESEEQAEEEVTSSKKQRTRTIRMSQAEIYHALYFDVLTERALIEKISDLFSIHPDQIIEAFVAGPSGINIIVTDDVIQNFVDQSRYHLEVEQDEDDTSKYRLLMKLLQ